ncbi:putative leader peptide [Herbidospora cretacea]|uniref:putative leader peptide n=1 Tax=Herbidospora cretacea TaxID=28444 RepID=UPI0034E2BD3E
MPIRARAMPAREWCPNQWRRARRRGALAEVIAVNITGPPVALRVSHRVSHRASHTLDANLDINYPRGIVTDMPVDPMLVVRRHVDLQRVRSAICIDAR